MVLQAHKQRSACLRLSSRMNQYFPLLLLLLLLLLLPLPPLNSAFELKCPSKMTAIRNQSVTLPYYTEPPTNLTTSSLEWIYNETYDVIVYRNQVDDPHSQKAEFKGTASIFPEQLPKGNGSLKLPYPISGRYCLRLPDGRMCCIDLTVYKPGELEKGIGMPSSNPWIIPIGVIIGVMIGVIVIAGVIALIVFKKKNRKEKKEKANCLLMPEPTVYSRTDCSSTPHSTLLICDARPCRDLIL